LRNDPDLESVHFGKEFPAVGQLAADRLGNNARRGFGGHKKRQFHVVFVAVKTEQSGNPERGIKVKFIAFALNEVEGFAHIHKFNFTGQHHLKAGGFELDFAFGDGNVPFQDQRDNGGVVLRKDKDIVQFAVGVERDLNRRGVLHLFRDR
jgi:hypothetical protein